MIIQGLLLMGYGLLGVFAALTAFFFLILLMNLLFKSKKPLSVPETITETDEIQEYNENPEYNENQIFDENTSKLNDEETE